MAAHSKYSLLASVMGHASGHGMATLLILGDVLLLSIDIPILFLLDCSVTFGMVDHQMFLSHLYEDTGVNRSVSKWFRAFSFFFLFFFK